MGLNNKRRDRYIKAARAYKRKLISARKRKRKSYHRMKQLKKWLKYAVFYMETRKGILILGQLLNFPYIRFYEEFTDNPQAPLSGELRNKNILFTVEVLSRVLRQGNFIYRKDIDSDRREIDSKLWIRSLDGFYRKEWKKISSPA